MAAVLAAVTVVLRESMSAVWKAASRAELSVASRALTSAFGWAALMVERRAAAWADERAA